MLARGGLHCHEVLRDLPVPAHLAVSAGAFIRVSYLHFPGSETLGCSW